MSGRKNNKAKVAKPANVVVPGMVRKIEANVAGKAPAAAPSAANIAAMNEARDAARARREAAAKRQAEAAEAARVKAEAEVEAARVKAEVEAARVKAEVEAARAEELQREFEVVQEFEAQQNEFVLPSPKLKVEANNDVANNDVANNDVANNEAPAPSRLARFGRALLAAAGVVAAGGAAYLANQARVARNRNAYGPAFGPEARENAADEVVRRDLATKTPAELKAIREAIHNTQNDGYCDFANNKAPRDLRGQPRHLVVAYKEGFEKQNPPTIENSVNNTKFRLQ